MSSSRSIDGSTCEGTRVVPKEITATPQDTPLIQSRKNDDDNPASKTAELEIHFAHELANVPESVTCSIAEKLSSTSFNSFLSTKDSSASSGFDIPSVADISYMNPDISGLEELILKCGNICLQNERNFQDLCQDQTFVSATEETSFHANDYNLKDLPEVNNERQVTEPNSQLYETAYVSLNQTHTFESTNSTIKNCQSTVSYPLTEEHLPQAEEFTEESISTKRTDNIVNDTVIFNGTNSVVENSLSPNNVNDNQINPRTVPSNNTITESGEEAVLKSYGTDIVPLDNSKSYSIKHSISFVSSVAQKTENQLLSSISKVPSLLENTDNKAKESNVRDLSESATHQSFLNDDKRLLPVEIVKNSIVQSENSAVSNETESTLCNEDIIAACNKTQIIKGSNSPEIINIEEKQVIAGSVPLVSAIKEKHISNNDLERTLTLQEIDINLAEEQYSEFKPQRQSTRLLLTQEEELNSKDLKLTAQEVTNDLLNSSPDLVNETNQFVSATAEIFQDPLSFDFLLARSNSGDTNRLRAESLYLKFDPLVSNTSMSPQMNSPSKNEKQTDDENKTPLPDVGTPKHNVAIAAIDRLLFYSPLPGGTLRKLEKSQEKIDQEENLKSDVSLIDINMTKELQLVRDTVLQLEEKLENQKISFQEIVDTLQAQLTQKIETNTQMTIVIEEYEKSISRLSTEQERDRLNFDQEKTKLQEELQAANYHLTNTEAAFNDVHQKYERLKKVIAIYKNNETVLKESIQENVNTIKALETRYDQLKNHAMVQLENANLELEEMRKKNETEMMKLHAIIKKAELQNNSQAEMLEQKTKENKELTKILDEVIARVGHTHDQQ